MELDVSRDMKWSAKLFTEQIWPMCRDRLGGGELLQMEGRPDIELARTLDMRAGIDGWHLHHDGMRGIASRVQKGTNWRTFTIRMARDSGSETEYSKRVKAITQPNMGWIYPAITIQAYAASEDGPILSIGVARTADIISFIGRGLHKVRRTSNATFAFCPWDRRSQEALSVTHNLLESKYRVFIIDCDKETVE